MVRRCAFLKCSTTVSPTSPTEKLPELKLYTPLTVYGSATAFVYAATASEIASMGRQMLGLFTVSFPSVFAFMYIVFTIKSKRIRGLYPEIVPFRKLITEKSLSSRCNTAYSPCAFEIPYGFVLVSTASSDKSFFPVIQYTEPEQA